jgi:HK97 family phage portal protein
MGRIRDWWSRSLEGEQQAAVANETRWYNPNVIPAPGVGIGSESGVYVSERSALQHLAVYSCVRLLADNIASLPMDTYRWANRRQVKLDSPQTIMQPNSHCTGWEHVQQVVTSLALRGNSYEHVLERDRLEYPTARETVHPDDMMLTRNQTDGQADYQIRGTRVPRADIIHIKRFSLAGSVIGLSPIEQARQGIGLSLAAERYGAHWFGDSADPSSVLETDGNLDDVATQRIMKGWISSQGGRRHPAVLSGGLHYRPIAISPNESQFLETREFQRGEIAMLYGIPPHMIGDTAKSTSWGTGIEQQSMGFVKYSLLPWLRCIEEVYSWLILPRGQFMRFNVDGLMRADMPTRYSSYTQARNAGWMNIDEIRALENMDPLPDGNGTDYLQPLNMGIVGDPPPKPTPPQPADVPPTDGEPVPKTNPKPAK